MHGPPKGTYSAQPMLSQLAGGCIDRCQKRQGSEPKRAKRTPASPARWSSTFESFQHRCRKRITSTPRIVCVSWKILAVTLLVDA